MYQCETINASTNACEHWVEVGFMNLPDITQEQAFTLCSAIALLLCTAFVFKILLNFILKK